MSTLSSTLDGSFNDLSQSSPSVPGKFPVAIAGHAYNIDVTFNVFGTKYKHQSIEFLREQADNSQEPGEGGINPAATWVRSQHSWHHGAGQDDLDHKGSGQDADADRERFRYSKGIDPWTKGQLKLLPGTLTFFPTSSTVPVQPAQVLTAGNYLLHIPTSAGGTDANAYVNGTNLASLSGTLLNTSTGLVFYQMASDGSNVWATAGSSGIYQWTLVDWNPTQYISDDCTNAVVGYSKARLMVGLGAALYNVTASGTLPTALFTQANDDFKWVGFAEGDAYIYAGGYSGHKSLVYKIQVLADASTLDQPIVAGQLPDGEILYSIFGYLGFIFLGTSAGVRFCNVQADGNLTIGDAISTPNPVECFAGWGRYVYFGLTNFDGSSTGIGRLDVRTLGDPGAQQLAWASDLMVTGQGRVTSLAVFNGFPYFSVLGLGDYGPLGTGANYQYVTSGQLTTGTFDYGMVPEKVSTSVDVHYGTAQTGSYTLEIATDGNAWQMIGYQTDTVSALKDSFQTRQARGSTFELRHTLVRTAATVTPSVTGWMCNTQPANAGWESRIWAIQLADADTDEQSGTTGMNVGDELAFIKSLHVTRQIIPCQEGDQSFLGMVWNYEFHPTNNTTVGRDLNGVMILELKVIP